MGAGFDFTDPNSPLAPYYLRASDVVGVALLSFLFVLLAVLPLFHSDIWGHLKFGQRTVMTGRLVRAPLCEFEEPQTPFRTVYWLGQVGLYLVYETGDILMGHNSLRGAEGGVDCLRGLHAVLCIARFVILWLAFRRLTSSRVLALVGLVLAFALGAGHIGVFRPQVIAELLFCCLLLALSRPVLSNRALWLIPLTLVVWANCHGSFLVGLCLLGLCLLGRALELKGFRGLRAPWRLLSDAQVGRLIVVLVVSVYLVAMLNPAGPALYLNTLRMAGHYAVQTMDEWKPLSWGPGSATPWTWFYLVTLIIVAATWFLSPRRFSPTQLLLVLFFGLQPALRQRMLVWWLMVVPWVILPHWAAIAARLPYRLASRGRQPPDSSENPGADAPGSPWQSTPSFRKTLLAGFLVLLAASWLPPVHWLLGGEPTPFQRSLSPGTPWQLPACLPYGSTVPETTALGPLVVAAVADQKSLLPSTLLKDYPDGRFVGRIFASESLADYLLWALPPEQSVLVYSHVHLFPPIHWWHCLLIKFGTTQGKEVLDQLNVNLIVCEAEMHPQAAGLAAALPGLDRLPGRDWADQQTRSPLPAICGRAEKTDQRDCCPEDGADTLSRQAALINRNNPPWWQFRQVRPVRYPKRR